jgi:hypothetical protein
MPFDLPSKPNLSMMIARCHGSAWYENSYGPNPYEFIGFGDGYGPKPYKFIGFGDSYGPKPYKFIGFGDMQSSSHRSSLPRMLLSLSSPLSGPNLALTFTSNHSAMSPSTHVRSPSFPLKAKSSPCTTHDTSRSRCQNATKPYEFTRFGDIHGPKPYELIGFGDIHRPKPYEFIGFGDIHGPASSNLLAYNLSHAWAAGRKPYSQCTSFPHIPCCGFASSGSQK